MGRKTRAFPVGMVLARYSRENKCEGGQ